MEFLLTLITLTTLAIVLLILGRKYKISLSQNKGLIYWSLSCVVLVIGFIYFVYTPPAHRIGPEQPISFSHQVHAGVKNIQCRFCHPYVDQSISPGIPPVEKCLYCHNYIIAGHPEIEKEHRFYNTRKPTPWIKANYLAEHVLFNHQRHIKKDIQCQQCHGEIETLDRIRGRYFFMEFCIQCHREKKANLDCWLACHS